MSDLKPTIYFFGAVERPGHYLFAPWGEKIYQSVFDNLDGQLAPAAIQEEQFIAQPWRLRGYLTDPWSALSWWDRTGDGRPGSNSTIFAPGDVVTIEGMVSEARRLFPKLDARLRRVRVIPAFKEKSR